MQNQDFWTQLLKMPLSNLRNVETLAEILRLDTSFEEDLEIILEVQKMCEVLLGLSAFKINDFREPSKTTKQRESLTEQQKCVLYNQFEMYKNDNTSYRAIILKLASELNMDATRVKDWWYNHLRAFKLQENVEHEILC